jgi:hypothetical protein
MPDSQPKPLTVGCQETSKAVLNEKGDQPQWQKKVRGTDLLGVRAFRAGLGDAAI